jgi:hypothetical protein
LFNIVRGFDTPLGLSSGICGKEHLQSLAIRCKKSGHIPLKLLRRKINKGVGALGWD